MIKKKKTVNLCSLYVEAPPDCYENTVNDRLVVLLEKI